MAGLEDPGVDTQAGNSTQHAHVWELPPSRMPPHNVTHRTGGGTAGPHKGPRAGIEQSP